MKWVPLFVFMLICACVIVWSIPQVVNPVCTHPIVSQRARKIKVLTYNTYLLGIGKKSQKRFRYFIQHYMNNYDILCLQEVFDIPYKRRMIWEAKKLGFHYFYASPFRYGMDSGLLVLSRFPLINTTFTPFRCSTHIDRVAQKGIIAVSVWVNNMCFQLINTHTQSFYCIYDKQALDILKLQSIQIKNEINKQGPVVLCGDLNGLRMEDCTDLKRLSNELLFTGKMKFNRNGVEIDDGNVIVPLELDTILYRELNVCEYKIEKFECNIGFGYCSDHFGLSATLCFE